MAMTNGNGSVPPLTSSISNGAPSHDGPVDAPLPFDVSLFRSYLLSLLPPVLGAYPEELISLFDDEFDEKVSRFAAEGGGVIYVVKVKEDTEGEVQTWLWFDLDLTHNRGSPSKILLSTHVSAQLFPFEHHLAGPHQTRSNPRSTHSSSYPATYPEFVWG